MVLTLLATCTWTTIVSKGVSEKVLRSVKEQGHTATPRHTYRSTHHLYLVMDWVNYVLELLWQDNNVIILVVWTKQD